MPPIKPEEVVKQKRDDIPEEVFEVWNSLIAKNFSGRSSTVYQKEIAEAIRMKMGLEKVDPVYENKWLDIEDIYRAAGWNVTYDKPCYYGGDNYEAHFIFKKGKQRGIYQDEC